MINMVDLKPKIKETRFGFKVFVCPRCGHVFRTISKYNQHVMKSHRHLIEQKDNKNVQ